ncbi:hypothetical protein M3Y97_00689600 [Aphelenchoides bicaudatus]|nr:hypothetical protein M3Y97_00689600 [Aphelenchoides bicaudatus]
MNEGNNEKEDKTRENDEQTEKSVESMREEMDAIREKHANLMRAIKEKTGAIPDVRPIIIPDARQRAQEPIDVITLSDSSSNSSRANSPGHSTTEIQNPPVTSNAQSEADQQASSNQNNPAECSNKRVEVKTEEVPVTDNSTGQQAQIASTSKDYVQDSSTTLQRSIKKEQLPVNDDNSIEKEQQPSIDMQKVDQIVNDIIAKSEPMDLPADNNESQPIKPAVRQNCHDCKLPKEIYAKDRCRICCFKLAKRLEHRKKEKPSSTRSPTKQEAVKTNESTKASTSFSADQQEMSINRCLACKFEITTETWRAEHVGYCKTCYRVRGNLVRNCIICNAYAKVIGHGSCSGCYYLYRSGIQQQPFHKQGRIVFRKINNQDPASSTPQASGHNQTPQSHIKQELSSSQTSAHDENSPQSLLRKVSSLFNGNCDVDQTSSATPKTPVNPIPEGMNPVCFKPKGWRKGQCKTCSCVLNRENVTLNTRDCKNYCDHCYIHNLNQRVCAKCNQKSDIMEEDCAKIAMIIKKRATKIKHTLGTLGTRRRRGPAQRIETTPNGNVICQNCRVEYQFINNLRTSMTLCAQCFQHDNLVECISCKQTARHYARGRCRPCYSVFIKTCTTSGRLATKKPAKPAIRRFHNGDNRLQHSAAPPTPNLSLNKSAGPSTSKIQAAKRLMCKDCKIQVANHSQFNFRKHRCLSCFSKFINRKHLECVDCRRILYIQAGGRCSACYKNHRFGGNSLFERFMPKLTRESNEYHDGIEDTEENCVRKEVKEEKQSPVKTAQSNRVQNSAHRSSSSRQGTPAMSTSSEKTRKCQFCAIYITEDKVCAKTPLICNDCFQVNKQKLRVCLNCEELCKHHAHGMCDSCYYVKISKPRLEEKKRATPQPSNSAHERSADVPTDPFHTPNSGMIICEDCNEKKLRYAVGLCSACYMKRFKGIVSSNSTDPILKEEKPERSNESSTQKTGICADCSQIKLLVGDKRCRPCFDINKAYLSPSKAKKIKTEEKPPTSSKPNGPSYRKSQEEDDDVIVLD